MFTASATSCDKSITKTGLPSPRAIDLCRLFSRLRPSSRIFSLMLYQQRENRMRNKVTDKLIVVTGAGGFIGGSLVASLRQRGCGQIRAVDMKPLENWYQKFDDVENLSLGLT